MSIWIIILLLVIWEYTLWLEYNEIILAENCHNYFGVKVDCKAAYLIFPASLCAILILLGLTYQFRKNIWFVWE